VNAQSVELRAYARLLGEIEIDGRLPAVADLLMRASEQFGSQKALIAPDRTLTYAQLLHFSLVMAECLRAHDVEPGERVLLYIPNCTEFYCAYFATWHVGAVAVPLNVYLHAKEVALIFADAQPRVVLTHSSMKPQLDAVLAEMAVQPAVVVLDTYLWQFAYSAEECAQRLQALPPVRAAEQDSAVILYTSGSTGVPKGVVLSGKNVLSNTLQTRVRFEMMVGSSTSAERFLAVLPLFHAFSQMAGLWLPVMMGASIVVVPKIERRALLQGLALKPTIFFGFPALFGLLIMMRTAPLDSVKFFVSGADALPDKIRMAFSLIYGRKICSGYGLTEASPVVSVDGESQDAPTNVVGRPLVGVRCQIRDEDHNPLPIGKVGVLWVAGDNIMQGYYNAPQLTKEVLHNGWLNTGDLASIDARGMITIVGRSKELIINKGFNIYPQEVENVLLRHPAVFKAAVVAKDEEGDQVPVAYVALREGTIVSAHDISLFCRNNLAAYKVPRVITCMADLPMTATGKIDKQSLRKNPSAEER